MEEKENPVVVKPDADDKVNKSTAFNTARKLVADYSSGSETDSDEDSVDSEPDSPASKPPVQPNTGSESAEESDNELEELTGPIEELKISLPPEQCKEIGVVKSIVEKRVVIKPNAGFAALDLDSVLFLDEGKRALGRIEDVFGPIHDPFYSVMFNSAKEIAEKNIKPGVKIYYAPSSDHTSYVCLPELMKMKGSDASWEENAEPPPEVQDFSDDEEEKRARNKTASGGKRSHSPPRTRRNPAHKHRENHPNNPRGHHHRQQRMPRSMPPVRPPLNFPWYPPPSATTFNPNVPLQFSMPPPPSAGPPFLAGPPPRVPFAGFPMNYFPPRFGSPVENLGHGSLNPQASPSVVEDRRNYQKQGP